MAIPRGGWIIIVWGLLASVPGARADQSPKKPSKDKQTDALIKEGKVRVVRGFRGGDPQLTDDSNMDWYLAGPLQSELMRLSGHRVQVWATSGQKKLDIPVLDVSRYEILDSGGGRKPLVGLLRWSDAKELLLQQDRGMVKITGRPTFIKQLEQRIGCRVWIVGNLEGKDLNAFKFGWLKCDTEKNLKMKKERKK